VVVRALRSRAGSFEIRVIARGSFAAAAGGEPDPVLTLTIGGQCTRQAVSRRMRPGRSRSPT
jgi:hypothetical protein